MTSCGLLDTRIAATMVRATNVKSHIKTPQLVLQYFFSKQGPTTMNRRTKTALGVAALLLSFEVATSRAAYAEAVDCHPVRVRSYHDRMDMRCQDIDRWYIAMRSQAAPDHIKEMLSLITTAILSGKIIKIYFEPDGVNGRINGIEIFK